MKRPIESTAPKVPPHHSLPTAVSGRIFSILVREGFQRPEVPLELRQRLGAVGLDDELILQLVDQGNFVLVFRVEHLDAHSDAQVFGVPGQLVSAGAEMTNGQ